MKGKNKLIALVVMLVLMMQMTGCGGAAASGSENVINTWAGYEADAANGLRVKSVEFRLDSASEMVSKIEYDMEGNITYSLINHANYEPFFEKALGISAPFECGAIHEFYGYCIDDCYFFLNRENLSFYVNDHTLQMKDDGSYVLYVWVSDKNNHSLHCLADGRVIQRKNVYMNGKDTFSTTENYNYDNIGRVTEYSWIRVSKYEGGDSRREETNVRYTYVEDSSYLESIVYNEDHVYTSGFTSSDLSDAFFKKTYEYDYDDSHNIVKVKQYLLTDEMQLIGTLQCVWEYEYDENGNVVCETKVESSDEGDISTTTRYQYDNDGNVIEKCEYEIFGSEENMTSKIEYKYGNTIAQRKTLYDSDWKWSYGEFYEGYDEVNDCWTVTYYTQEEIDQYMHD